MCLAPLVPRHSWLRFVMCGLGVAWHLCLCRGSLRVVRPARVCGTRWPFLLGTCPCALVMAVGVPLWRASWPRVGALRLVRSSRSRCSGRLSRCRGAFPYPGGLRPPFYWVAARGTWRPAENRALCASRWPLLRQGRWAGSASYPFGAPRWGCPWRVPPASVLGCVRCGGFRVWTRSLTPPVSCTVCLSAGHLAGAPGLSRVDADTAPFGSEDATPGSRVCVRVRALLGQVGRAGLLGALWCASPSPVAALGVLLVFLAPSGVGLACLWLLLGFCFCFCFPCCAPVVSGVLCVPARDAFGLGVLWSSAPPPGPFFLFSFFFLFFFSLCAALSVVFCGFQPVVLWALASCRPPARSLFWFFLLFSPPPPPSRFFYSCSCFLFVCLFFSASAFVFFFVPVPRCLGWLVCPALWGVLVCFAVALVPRRGLVCACAVSLVAPSLCLFCVCRCLSCGGVVVCFVVCPVLCGVPVLGLFLAHCCCPLWPLPGPLSWPVVMFSPGVRCCVALLVVCRAVWCCLCRVLLVVPCCFVRAGWCCVLLPVVAGCSLLGLVACCCFLLACVVPVAPAWPRGLLPCCVLCFVVMPRSPVL